MIACDSNYLAGGKLCKFVELNYEERNDEHSSSSRLSIKRHRERRERGKKRKREGERKREREQ